MLFEGQHCTRLLLKTFYILSRSKDFRRKVFRLYVSLLIYFFSYEIWSTSNSLCYTFCGVSASSQSYDLFCYIEWHLPSLGPTSLSTHRWVVLVCALTPRGRVASSLTPILRTSPFGNRAPTSVTLSEVPPH